MSVVFESVHNEGEGLIPRPREVRATASIPFRRRQQHQQQQRRRRRRWWCVPPQPPSDATHTVLCSAHIYDSVRRISREPPAVTMRSGARPPPLPLDAALRVCLVALVCVTVAASEGAVHHGESRRVADIILDQDCIAIKCIFFVV